MKLIDEWRRAHKYLTVKLAVLLGAISTAWDYVPAVRDYLDPTWLKWFAVVMIVARVIKQDGVRNGPDAS
jgi:hypothetical protein